MIRNLPGRFAFEALIVILMLFPPALKATEKKDLIEIAESDRQWTGVAVSKEGRIFVSYPRWSDGASVSVAELASDGTLKPFPDKEWNSWGPGLSTQDHFVCVQSVYVDSDNFLWIVDSANPKAGDVVKDGAKLLKVDLKTNQVIQRIYFDETVAQQDSYFRNFRVDTKNGYGYLSDSGTGALISIKLWNGQMRRLLADHFSTKAERIIVNVNGNEFRKPDGRIPQIDVVGIALDKTGRYLYFHALSGRKLYRIETRWLRDESLSDEHLGRKVESPGTTGPVDGMEFGPDGNLYFAAIEENAIKRLTPDLQIEPVVQDRRLAWPGALAVGPDGMLYIITTQVHLWGKPLEPYRLFKINIAAPADTAPR